MSYGTSPHKTYIVIVTYNGMPWIQKCLESCGTFPVIVVDNGSTDATVSYIKEHFPQVQIVEQEHNLGFGQGNNVGIHLALEQGAEYVFLLNQDAYLEENTIATLVSFQKKNPEYGILSPVHYNGVGDRIDENFVLYLNRYNLNKVILFDALSQSPAPVYPIDFINAAGWLISRNCLEMAGGFDPLFFHYGEDRNYCQRVNYHGLVIGIVTAVSLRHDREDRKVVPIKKYSDSYYSEYERYAKVAWGDIALTDFTERYDNKLKYLFRKAVKYFLRFQFAKGNDAIKKRSILRRLKPALIKSRQLNVRQYSSYLDL